MNLYVPLHVILSPKILAALITLERLLHPRDEIQNAGLDFEVEPDCVVLESNNNLLA